MAASRAILLLGFIILQKTTLSLEMCFWQGQGWSIFSSLGGSACSAFMPRLFRVAVAFSNAHLGLLPRHPGHYSVVLQGPALCRQSSARRGWALPAQCCGTACLASGGALGFTLRAALTAHSAWRTRCLPLELYVQGVSAFLDVSWGCGCNWFAGQSPGSPLNTQALHVCLLLLMLLEFAFKKSVSKLLCVVTPREWNQVSPVHPLIRVISVSSAAVAPQQAMFVAQLVLSLKIRKPTYAAEMLVLFEILDLFWMWQ